VLTLKPNRCDSSGRLADHQFRLDHNLPWIVTPLNPAHGLPTILPNQSPPHIYSNLAPFTFGSDSTVVSYSHCGPPICATVTPKANSLFGTAINGLQGRVLELQARMSF
jgi:hypothetical protein